eukprot:747390-Hanusia_phi.AAC.1
MAAIELALNQAKRLKRSHSVNHLRAVDSSARSEAHEPSNSSTSCSSLRIPHHQNFSSPLASSRSHASSPCASKKSPSEQPTVHRGGALLQASCHQELNSFSQAANSSNDHVAASTSPIRPFHLQHQK